QQPDRKRLQLIQQPAPERLLRQAIAALEEESAVEGDRKGAEFVEEEKQRDVEDDGEDRAAGEITQPHARAADEQPGEQHHRPQDRQHAGLPLQSVVTARSILVHGATGSFPFSDFSTIPETKSPES